MAANKTIKVDLWNKMRERITVVQREVLGRTLTFHLYSGATPINLTGGAVTFYAVLPDTTTEVFNACTLTTPASGICTYTFTEATIVQAGNLRCWLVCVDASANERRTQEFAIEVQASPDFTSSVEGTSEYSALEVALALVGGHEARITAAEAAIVADVANLASGWIPRTETFAYASATTITVATGAALRWQTGDMVKFTQHGSVKYFYVITVADTLLTVIGNGAVVVEDTATYAITLINFSRHGRPLGFPQWFTYTPVYSASGSMTFTKTANQSEKFTLVGKTVLMELSAGGTTGGTASDQILVTVPVAFTSATANVFGGGAFTYDAAYLGGSWTNADATHVAIRKYDGSNWALAVSKYFSLNFSYDIA